MCFPLSKLSVRAMYSIDQAETKKTFNGPSMPAKLDYYKMTYNNYIVYS